MASSEIKNSYWAQHFYDDVKFFYVYIENKSLGRRFPANLSGLQFKGPAAFSISTHFRNILRFAVSPSVESIGRDKM